MLRESFSQAEGLEKDVNRWKAKANKVPALQVRNPLHCSAPSAPFASWWDPPEKPLVPSSKLPLFLLFQERLDHLEKIQMEADKLKRCVERESSEVAETTQSLQLWKNKAKMYEQASRELETWKAQVICAENEVSEMEKSKDKAVKSNEWDVREVQRLKSILRESAQRGMTMQKDLSELKHWKNQYGMMEGELHELRKLKVRRVGGDAAKRSEKQIRNC